MDLFAWILNKKNSGGSSGTPVDLTNYATKSFVSTTYARKDEIRAYMPFKSGWRTNSTISNFCYDVDHDNEAVEGMTFLGELHCNDFHSKGVNISNGEAVVEIIKENGVGGGKTIHIILTSGTTYPYRWEYTYWGQGGNQHGWTGFYPMEDGKIPATALTQETQNILTNRVTPSELEAALATVYTKTEVNELIPSSSGEGLNLDDMDALELLIDQLDFKPLALGENLLTFGEKVLVF